jgi:RHS repeat-associated protein
VEPTAELTDHGFTGHKHNAYIKLVDMKARWYDPQIGRFIQPDSIVPDPVNPQALNRYSYVTNSPLRYIDPSGHFSCDGDDNCHDIIENWLSILAEQGGDVGKQLEQSFRIMDITIIINGTGYASLIPDTIHINIVDDLGPGVSMQADVNNMTISIARNSIEQANKSEQDILIKVGEFGHEIKHLDQGPLVHASLHSELDAYEAQYQLYVAMGVEEAEGASSAVAVHESYSGMSDYELVNSPFSTMYYTDLPLHKSLWWADNAIRDFNSWWHDTSHRLSEWWSEIW